MKVNLPLPGHNEYNCTSCVYNYFFCALYLTNEYGVNKNGNQGFWRWKSYLHYANTKQVRSIDMLLLCVITYRACVDSVSIIMLLIWRHWLGSTMEQSRACCPTAPNHYLNQCWLTGYYNWKNTIRWNQYPTTPITLSVSREYGFSIVVENTGHFFLWFCLHIRSALSIILETFRAALFSKMSN